MSTDNGFPPDKGCELAPSCLKCPFPYCYKEEKSDYLRKEAYTRIVKAVSLRSEGVSTNSIAEIFGVTPRTIFRWLKKYHSKGTLTV